MNDTLSDLRDTMVKIIISFGVILCLMGCVHTSTWETGKPIRGIQMQKIVKGQTTSSEIISLFGAPTSTSTTSQEEFFIYKFCRQEYSVSRISGSSKEYCNELTISFDKNTGKVKDYNYQKGIPD